MPVRCAPANVDRNDLAAVQRELREIGDRWTPWRSVAACLFWQSYLHARGRAAPQLAPELYASEA